VEIKTPSTVKEWFATIGAIGTVIVMVFTLYLHMHTDLEAAEVKQDLQEEILRVSKLLEESNARLTDSIDRSEVLRLRREIKRLKQDNNDPNISVFEINQNQIDIEYYEDVIECIQAQQKNCV
jgi:hypothetical protein